MTTKYNEIYQSSINNPEKFWQEISEDIFWFKKPTKVLNKFNPPFYKWSEDGVTNTCYNALDYNIEQGRGEKTALIYDSPITGNKAKFTYKELRHKVSKFAGALDNQGIKKGDRVIIYMPMVPEAVIAMLACGRIGAIHSVVFGGFASNELASRIDNSKAKILITASCGFEPGKTVEYRPLVDGALKLAKHKIEKIIFFQRKGYEIKLNSPKEISWNEVLSNSKRFAVNIAESLRERIYESIIPRLALGISKARNLINPSKNEIALTYEIALTVLFRLLFIAYAEDRDLLPYKNNQLYKKL